MRVSGTPLNGALWTLALSNHASDHTYFTYRNLCGAFFALLALPALLAPDQTPSP